MPLFRIADGKMQRLKSKISAKEKDLQRLVEANLLEALDVHFLETEYATTSGGRIDTLGVDRNGAPTVIEYKRTQNDNVINQGLSYLKWLSAQKPEFFEMLMSKRLPKDVLGNIILDWKHPRIICIAENFNRFDIDTVDIVPINIELMTYRFYEGGVFSLESSQVVSQRQVAPQIGASKPDTSDANAVENSVDARRARASEEMRSVFDDLRARILALGPQVVERLSKSYIAYRVSKNFMELHIRRTQIRVYLRPIEYLDPEVRVRKVPESFRWTLDREVHINSEADLDYVMKLIEQSYNDVV